MTHDAFVCLCVLHYDSLYYIYDVCVCCDLCGTRERRVIFGISSLFENKPTAPFPTLSYGLYSRV